MKVKIIHPKPKKTEVKKRACAYVRVSTDNETQVDSLENQILHYTKYIQSSPAYEYLGVFADQGSSGTKKERPEFQRMLEMAREGKIDVILTKSISRFARNTALMLEVVRELKDLAVEVIFEKEGISTMSGDGELMLTVLSSFAQEESRNVSENLKWAARRKFQRGEVMINTARFLGYDKDEAGHLIVNSEEAKTVKRIFREYLEGKGVDAIAKGLNDDGIQTVGKKKWHGRTILIILKNEKYCGDAHLQKTYTPDGLRRQSRRNNGILNSYYIENNHMGIVSKECWNEVQLEMKRRADAKGIKPGTTWKGKKRYPLSGLLYCSKCGSVLIRGTAITSPGQYKVIWRCKNYAKNGKEVCAGTTIEEAEVLKHVIDKETVVKEEGSYGKKSYTYTRKK